MLSEMRELAIYGAGGFGREVFCLVNKINEVSPTWKTIGFFDDGVGKGTAVGGYGYVLGGMDELNEWDKELDVVVAVGSIRNLMNITGRITNPRICFPNVFHPDVVFADRSTFSCGKGNIVQRASAFSCDVTIGDFNIFNGGTVLGHDVRMGSFNVLMPAVRVSGGVSAGDSNFLGISSIVLQGLRMGDNVTLSAGSVLMTKPKSGCLYMGNPAKRTEF